MCDFLICYYYHVVMPPKDTFSLLLEREELGEERERESERERERERERDSDWLPAICALTGN